MVSTIAILSVAGLSLFLVWTLLRPGLPQIGSLEDWEAKRHEVDLAVLRILIDPGEERYLRSLFSPPEYRRMMRRRLTLALNSLGLIGENAAMLMKLGQLAKAGANPALAQEAEELSHGALRLRVNLMLVEPYLRVKWLFPGWTLSVPAFEMPYEELLSYLNRLRQQQQWELSQALRAG